MNNTDPVLEYVATRKIDSETGRLTLADKIVDRTLNGFDYDNQAWVVDGKYIRCGHLDSMNCNCFGKKHEGETVSPAVAGRIREQ